MDERQVFHIENLLIVSTTETVSHVTVERLLASQGQTNRLAAEQDIAIMEMEAELVGVKAELELLREKVQQIEKEKKWSARFLLAAFFVLAIGLFLQHLNF